MCGISATGHQPGLFIGLENIDDKKSKVMYKCTKCGAYFCKEEIVPTIVSIQSTDTGLKFRMSNGNVYGDMDIHKLKPIQWKQIYDITVKHCMNLNTDFNKVKEKYLIMKSDYESLQQQIANTSCTTSVVTKYPEIYEAMSQVYESALLINIDKLVELPSNEEYEISDDVALFINIAIKRSHTRYWLYDRLRWDNTKNNTIIYKKRINRRK